MNAVAKLAGCACLSALLTLGSAPVFAAQPVLSDPLAAWPLNFGAQTSSISLKNGAVHITVPANSASWTTYSGFNFTDMDASVTVTPENATGNAAGLLFWATGPSDFFDFTISDTAGTFGVFKHVSTAASPWQTIVPYMKTSLLKPGAANVLRVVTKGNYVTLYINGQQAGSLSVMAPSGGGTVGIEGEGSAKGPSDYAFTNLTVSQP
jgi:hypothetical protein